VIGAVAMGASPIFVRLAEVGPFASAFWRTFLALPFLWAWARIAARGKDEQAGFDLAVLLAGLLFAGDLIFWHASILATTVANAAFLATTAPIWVALGAWLVVREPVGMRVLVGLALCLVGGFALVGQSYGYAPERLRGDLYGVTTALFFGVYMLTVRRARRRHAAARLILLSTTVTAACLFVVAFLVEPRLVPATANGLAALLALAVVSHVGGQGLLAVALGTLPATFSSLVIFLEAIAAAVFGWLLFGEALGLLQLVGGALILTGISIARPRRTEVVEGSP
jgi:drug/metabolite transporter (DMT)-like permease